MKNSIQSSPSSYFAKVVSKMEVDEGECVPSPAWREIFEATFSGASVRLKEDQGWRSMLGFDEIVIDGLWKKYGRRCRHGDSPLKPVQWLWFFSCLKLPGTWMFLSFLWRQTCTTFTTVINETLNQLESMVDEVRANRG